MSLLKMEQKIDVYKIVNIKTKYDKENVYTITIQISKEKQSRDSINFRSHHIAFRKFVRDIRKEDDFEFYDEYNIIPACTKFKRNDDIWEIEYCILNDLPNNKSIYGPSKSFALKNCDLQNIANTAEKCYLRLNI